MITYNSNSNKSTKVRFIDFGRSFQANGNTQLILNKVNNVIQNQNNYQFGMSMKSTLQMLNNIKTINIL